VQAAAHLELGNPDKARQCALAAVDLLEGEAGEAADFPQRDYFLCGQTLERVGDSEASQRAYGRARGILSAKAGKISDPAMRDSYLQSVAFNRIILESANGSHEASPNDGIAGDVR
jgi:hypothetical protein